MAEPEVVIDLDGVRLEIREGDLTQADTVAIANAANAQLWMGSGVAGAIKRAGGSEIESEALAHGPILPGTALLTSAGRLPFRAILHGAALGQDLQTTPELIARTTRSCLDLAEEQGFESLALPAFGAGVRGVELPETAEAMFAAVREFAAQKPAYLQRVVFVLFGFTAFHSFVEQVQAPVAPGGLV